MTSKGLCRCRYTAMSSWRVKKNIYIVFSYQKFNIRTKVYDSSEKGHKPTFYDRVYMYLCVCTNYDLFRSGLWFNIIAYSQWNHSVKHHKTLLFKTLRNAKPTRRRHGTHTHTYGARIVFGNSVNATDER